MLAREILGKRVRLPIVLVAVFMAFAVLQGNAEAVVLWSEDFDGLASGTVLTNANMPGWNMNIPGNDRIRTTSESAASGPNAIRTIRLRSGTRPWRTATLLCLLVTR